MRLCFFFQSLYLVCALCQSQYDRDLVNELMTGEYFRVFLPSLLPDKVAWEF